MLSSFINRRKVKKISLFDAALRRAQSSPSLDGQSDQESPRPKQWSLSKPLATAGPSLRVSAFQRQSSPKVHLDFTPSGSNDWFPQEILAPHEEGSHLAIPPIQESRTSSLYGDVVVIGPEQAPIRLKPTPSPALPPLPANDAPSPIDPGHDVTTPPLSRKPAPAPIKIPSHPSKVQIQRSASTYYSGLREGSVLFPVTHDPSNALQPRTAGPSSAVSQNDNSSAISGTTLARALIANSFILSNDNPGRNRYRSGANLPRQDSATLPGASDAGLLISPYWRDRRISGGEIVRSPDSGIDSLVPPVPPLPQSLSSALSQTRHMSTEVPRKVPSRSQSLRMDQLSNRASKISEQSLSLATVTASPPDNPVPATQTPASGSTPRPPLPQPPISQPPLSQQPLPQPQSNQTTPHDNLPNHSLDIPSSPPRNSSLNSNATSSNPEPVSVRRSQLPPSLNLPSSSTVTGSRSRPTPGDSLDEPQPTGASFNTMRTGKTLGSATSGEDITKVLTAYRFVSPMKSGFPVRVHESPDPSTPSSSPWSDGSRSHRTDLSSSTSLPQTPDSVTKRSRNGLSVLDMKRVFTDPVVPGQRQSGSSKPGLLPIGNDRPRSLQVPSSPFSRKSGESRRSTDGASPSVSDQRSSGVSSPDILDFMFIPSDTSLPSRPHPIRVVRESLDSFEGASDGSPTTAEALRQTFPETPQAFSPLFSANIGTAGVPPLPIPVAGTPGTPLSAAHARWKTKKGLPNPAAKRSASLHNRKAPLNPNRTRMSPIPSAPGTPQTPEVRKTDDVPKDSQFETQQLQAAATMLVTSLGTTRKTPSPVPLPSRRNSDPTGSATGDLETHTDRVETLEEVPRPVPGMKEPETAPSKEGPSQRSTPAPVENSPNPSVRNLGTAEVNTADPQDKDGNNADVSSASGLCAQGLTQSKDQVRDSGPKQRPHPLDLPVVNSDSESTGGIRPVTKQSDGSPATRQELESARPSSQVNATPRTGAVPVVSADTTTPVATPARSSPATPIHSSNPSEHLSPYVYVHPSPDPSSSHPSPNPSSISDASSPLPSSQRSPAQSLSSFNGTPTSSTSQVIISSPALPSSTLVSPAQFDQSRALGVPSFASFLRQSYGDLAAVNPPPPYQTAILSQAVPLNGETEPPVVSGPSLPSYVHATPTGPQGSGPRATQPAQLPQAQARRSSSNAASVGEGVVRERSDSTSDPRTPRNRPLGPRNRSGSQGVNKGSSLGALRSRQGSVSSAYPHPLRSEVGLGALQTSRKLSTTSCRTRSGPRFPTVPVKWRGYTLDVARWTFTSKQLQEISSRAIEASAESYYVRLLKLETLDTELPEELHRLELLMTDLKTRLRATAAARRELLDVLTAYSGTGTPDPQNLERIVGDLGEVTQSAEELNDELYTVADQIAQLKRLRDVHSSSALAVSLRKLNTSFLRQGAENQFLRERVSALEAERDIAWTQAEHVAREFDDLNAKLGQEQRIDSTPSSANGSRRASRVSAVRKSSVRASKSGLRQSIIGTLVRSPSIGSATKPPEGIPPVPPLPGMQDFGSPANRPPRHRPPVIQMVDLPGQLTPGGLYSEMTPTTETRAMAQAQRELCEMLGIGVTDLKAHKPRPRSMSGISRNSELSVNGLLRSTSDAKSVTPRRYSQPCREYLLSPYDRELTLANYTLVD